MRFDAKTAAVFGDWHGDLGFAARALEASYEKDNPDIYLHVGDFGLWPTDNEESWQPEYLPGLEKLLTAQRKLLLFVDGNHEEHKWLTTFPVSDHGLRKISDHIWHIPRGQAVMLGDKKLVGLGGARSVDRSMRIFDSTWFLEELISEEDFDETVANEAADILLTHEAPEAPWLGASFDNLSEMDSRIQRRYIERAARILGVTLLVHGHHHRRYSSDDLGYRVEGLGCNSSDSNSLEDNTILIDLEKL